MAILASAAVASEPSEAEQDLWRETEARHVALNEDIHDKNHTVGAVVPDVVHVTSKRATGPGNYTSAVTLHEVYCDGRGRLWRYSRRGGSYTMIFDPGIL